MSRPRTSLPAPSAADLKAIVVGVVIVVIEAFSLGLVIGYAVWGKA